MRRLSLGTLLTLVNVGLVIAAVVCVVLAAAGLLRRLADEQALARVGRAGPAGPARSIPEDRPAVGVRRARRRRRAGARWRRDPLGRDRPPAARSRLPVRRGPPPG